MTRIVIELSHAEDTEDAFAAVFSAVEALQIPATVEERDESDTLIIRASETTAELNRARPSRRETQGESNDV